MGESGVAVVELVNPQALESELVVELFNRAFADPDHPDATEVRKWLAEIIPNDALSVFVAIEEGAFRGLSIVALGTSPFEAPSTVIHFHSEGVRSELTGQMRAWMRERGVTHMWALNQTGRSDAVHMRAFREFATGRVVGTMLEYDIGNEA